MDITWHSRMFASKVIFFFWWGVFFIRFIFLILFYGTMVGICSVGVGVGECQSEDSFVFFGAKPTQREISYETGKRRGKVPEQRTERS